MLWILIQSLTYEVHRLKRQKERVAIFHSRIRILAPGSSILRLPNTVPETMGPSLRHSGQDDKFSYYESISEEKSIIKSSK